MKKSTTQNSKRGLWLSFAALAALLGIFAALPLQRAKQASAAAGDYASDILQITGTHAAGFEYYDIRTDKSAGETLQSFRAAAPMSLQSINNARSLMLAGEEKLRKKVPTLAVEYNADLVIPEVIAPDVKQGRAFLTAANPKAKKSEILRRFVRDNSSLIGLNSLQADELTVKADYTNPDGNLSFALLEQSVNGVPVFRGEIKAGFTRDGEMIRVINNLAPALDASAAPSNFGEASEAVNAAFKFVPREKGAADAELNATQSNNLKAVFGAGDRATTAEKMYFPIDAGVARAAWRVLVWGSPASFYVVVDAETGKMLWRKNITEEQNQPATYSVYSNSTSMVKTADNPAPLTPGPISPALGTQGIITPRNTVTLIGNEAPYTFNTNGWITDNTNLTDGNNVQAGLDRIAPDGVDAAVTGANRTFNFNFNPAPGNPTPGSEPLSSIDFQNGVVTQLFYTTNRYHDELYLLGFNEQAGNFQANNFNRGGSGNDRVSAEAQDSSGTNNANFSTPADGGRGFMQMYIFTPAAPDRDGSLDADIVIHELTHGTSNRLHGNASGLGSNMSRGMGEGWSDFYAHALLSEPTDALEGIYPTGGYATLNLRAGAPTGNYYYGIRRFPKAVRAFTGGPNNRPHNPLTFADIDSTQINTTDGAFAAAFTAAAPDQVHAAGEVWSTILWEVRGKFVQRLGGEAGNRKALQLVTDGMKLSPLSPTFVQSRDAILAAAQASNLAPEAALDVADTWSGFAARGMGFSARVLTAGTGGGTARVTEAFDTPNLTQNSGFAVSDAPGNNNGFPEPGENLLLTVPLTNTSGSSATGVSVQIAGGNSADYNTINNGQTVSRQIPFTVPANAVCGSVLTITFNVNSSLGATSFTKTIRLGQAVVTPLQNFDSVTAPLLPAGWTTQQTGSGLPWVTSTATPDTAPNSIFTTNPVTAGGADVTSAPFTVGSASSLVRFRNNYNTEDGWDGGILEISVAGGAFTELTQAGGSFVEGGYNGAVQGNSNPLGSRPAWTGNSGGYITTLAQLPASANNQQVQLRFRFGTDTNTGAVGWRVDTLEIINSFNCAPINPTAPTNSRADFDGDGKTDVSVFRNGNWFVQKSSGGFQGAQWGAAGDFVVPGDYNGDNKTDFGIFRPTTDPNATDVYLILSGTNTFAGLSWGQPGDVPAVGDYDGDNKDDFAVVRQSNYTWYILPTGGGAPYSDTVGQVCDRPVTGDFDGDGKTDVAGIRGGDWFIKRSTNGAVQFVNWGVGSDKFVPADYDNDNIDDVAVFRNGAWFIIRSTNGQVQTVNFGAAGDIPVPGDYDGDGADDIAVYRGGTWFIRNPSGGFASVGFGIAGDTPIPARYLP